MKAIRVHKFGGSEVLRLEGVTTPKPSAGQVLVRIHAAGVNPYDTYMRAGTYAIKPSLPYTPGSDGAGIVEAVGEGVKRVREGDRVYVARTLSGAYAEYALALEEQVHALPANIDFKQGAGIWVPYGTAYRALYHSAKAHPVPKRLIFLCILPLFLSTGAVAQPATPPEATLWDHNGSVVYLIANGSSREFYYKQPRSGMLEAGARPGSLLFHGRSIKG